MSDVASKSRKPTTRRRKAGTATRSGAPRAAAKAPKAKAPRRPKGTPRQRWAALKPKLDALFGEIRPPEGLSVIEKACWLILREGGTPAATERALKSLREDFVDWNDVRASRPSELARLLSGVSRASTLRKVDQRCRRLREMIDQVYGDRNDVSFEFIAELKAKERFEYLSELEDLGLHNACALAQWMSGDDKLVVVSTELCQAAQKLGLCDSAAQTKVRKELSALADGAELISMQAHLTQLGALDEPWPNAVAEFRV